jgi:hypothetical protein
LTFASAASPPIAATWRRMTSRAAGSELAVRGGDCGAAPSSATATGRVWHLDAHEPAEHRCADELPMETTEQILGGHIHEHSLMTRNAVRHPTIQRVVRGNVAGVHPPAHREAGDVAAAQIRRESTASITMLHAERHPLSWGIERQVRSAVRLSSEKEILVGPRDGGRERPLFGREPLGGNIGPPATQRTGVSERE